jgi:hypothetical protein
MHVDQAPSIKRMHLLIERQRSELPIREGRHIVVAHGALLKKYQKICLLFERAGPLIEEYGTWLHDSQRWPNGQLSRAQEEALEQSDSTKLEIETLFECFFLYSAILCDDVAQLVLYHFGPARGVKLGTHRELAKNLRAYCHDRDLTTIDAMESAASFLESEVCEFRDKQIVHDFHPRKIDSIVYVPAERSVSMHYAMLHPKETDKFVISRSWSQLQRAMEDYLWLSLGFINENRAKSRLLSLG